MIWHKHPFHGLIHSPRHASFFLACLIVVTFAMPAMADGFSFQPLQSVLVPGEADSVAIGDVTGDGLDDVVLVTRVNFFEPGKDKRILIYVQRADHQLSVPVTYFFPTQIVFDTSLKLVDLNRDGIKDIVLGYQYGITIMIADGNNGFAEKHYEDGYTRSIGLAVLDVNLDGNTDLIWNDWVLLMDVDYNVTRKYRLFTGPEIPVVYNALNVGDLNHDGFPDLAVHFNLDRGFVKVFYHDGISGFPVTPVELDPGFESWPIEASSIADLDSDGLPDLIVAQNKNEPVSLSLMRQSPDGQLSPAALLSTYQLPSSLQITDLNGDGANDIATIHEGWGPPIRLFGSSLGFNLQSNGAFLPETLFWMPYQDHYGETALSIGDVNGDGCNDAAIANQFDGLLLFRGVNCVIRQQADLALVSLRRGSVVELQIRNNKGLMSANQPVIEVSIEGKRITVTKVPVECVYVGNARFECMLPTMAQHAVHKLEFSVSSPPDGKRYLVKIKATAASDTTDYNLSNNIIAPTYAILMRRLMSKPVLRTKPPVTVRNLQIGYTRVP